MDSAETSPQFVARPDKMMGFTDAVKNCVRNNYLGFSGRASRSEYWWFMLFLQIVPIVGYVLVFAYISVALGEEGATMSFETLMNLLSLPSLVTPIALRGFLTTTGAVDVFEDDRHRKGVGCSDNQEDSVYWINTLASLDDRGRTGLNRR